VKKTVKVWWKSRVVWLNAVAGAVSALVIAWEPIGREMPVWLGCSLGVALAGANAFLRFVTTDSITGKQLDDRKVDP
jgi:hypothetical protein